MPLDTALEQLREEMFDLFLLTIEHNTVSIFFYENSVLKVFDSHARDSFGMPHPFSSSNNIYSGKLFHFTMFFKKDLS